MRDSIYHLLQTLINAIGGFIVFVIGVRFIFEFLDFNRLTPIVAWVYTVSDNLIQPFRGLLPDLRLGDGTILDVTALIALFSYAIVFALIDRLLFSILHPHGGYEYEDGIRVHRHAHE